MARPLLLLGLLLASAALHASPAAAAATIKCGKCTCSSATAPKLACTGEGRCVPEGGSGGSFQIDIECRDGNSVSRSSVMTSSGGDDTFTGGASAGAGAMPPGFAMPALPGMPPMGMDFGSAFGGVPPHMQLPAAMMPSGPSPFPAFGAAEPAFASDTAAAAARQAAVAAERAASLPAARRADSGAAGAAAARAVVGGAAAAVVLGLLL
ncbi:MAG: hypothetical protein J3K34DRAFT_473287 [Monoraphidium minutum]|nr:MAG: hypothetical protein J3K34DRAFT_473287 [Monoraphidium minutum]